MKSSTEDDSELLAGFGGGKKSKKKDKKSQKLQFLGVSDKQIEHTKKEYEDCKAILDTMKQELEGLKLRRLKFANKQLQAKGLHSTHLFLTRKLGGLRFFSP